MECSELSEFITANFLQLLLVFLNLIIPSVIYGLIFLCLFSISINFENVFMCSISKLMNANTANLGSLLFSTSDQILLFKSCFKLLWFIYFLK